MPSRQEIDQSKDHTGAGYINNITKLQIPFFGSGQKQLEYLPMFCYGRNSIRTPVGLLEFTDLGAIYSYHHGRLEYFGGSDRYQNSTNSSYPSIVLSNNDIHYPHTSNTSFN